MARAIWHPGLLHPFPQNQIQSVQFLLVFSEIWTEKNENANGNIGAETKLVSTVRCAKLNKVESGKIECVFSKEISSLTEWLILVRILTNPRFKLSPKSS